jgi:methylated-DNA-[protein]-cysteine S-methyltransferase
VAALLAWISLAGAQPDAHGCSDSGGRTTRAERAGLVAGSRRIALSTGAIGNRLVAARSVFGSPRTNAKLALLADVRRGDSSCRPRVVERVVVYNWNMNQIYYSRFESPVGPLLLAGPKAGLQLVSFAGGKRAKNVAPEWRLDNSAFVEVVHQLQSYFAGERRNFDLTLILEGSDFQKRVWTALQEIPYGETTSYKELAEKIGKPRAVRAVGAANGANPIPIIIPCHRVIGNDGSLTGFGGGLPLKKRLLELESYQLKLILPQL